MGALDIIKECWFLCPSAIGENSIPLYISSALYFATSMLALGELIFGSVKNYRSMGHVNFFTLRNTMLISSCVFMFVRGYTSLVVITWIAFTAVLVDYLLPTYFQFVLLILLLVLQVKFVIVMQYQKRSWLSWLYLGAAFASVLVLGLALIASWAITIQFDEDSYVMDGDSDDIRYASAIWGLALFGTLSLSTLVGGIIARRSISKIAVSPRKRKKVNQFSALLAGMVAVFIVRSMWYTVYLIVGDKVEEWVTHVEHSKDNRESLYIYYLFYHLFLEITPVLVLILAFRIWNFDSSIGSGARGIKKKKKKKTLASDYWSDEMLSRVHMSMVETSTGERYDEERTSLLATQRKRTKTAASMLDGIIEGVEVPLDSEDCESDTEYVLVQSIGRSNLFI